MLYIYVSDAPMYGRTEVDLRDDVPNLRCYRKNYWTNTLGVLSADGVKQEDGSILSKIEKEFGYTEETYLFQNGKLKVVEQGMVPFNSNPYFRVVETEYDPIRIIG